MVVPDLHTWGNLTPDQLPPVLHLPPALQGVAVSAVHHDSASRGLTSVGGFVFYKKSQDSGRLDQVR